LEEKEEAPPGRTPEKRKKDSSPFDTSNEPAKEGRGERSVVVLGKKKKRERIRLGLLVQKSPPYSACWRKKRPLIFSGEWCRKDERVAEKGQRFGPKGGPPPPPPRKQNILRYLLIFQFHAEGKEISGKLSERKKKRKS